ncbi:hypothetical protein KKF84_18740, partial [Myxococcota bacterium]|nr:hypothetical protein [Myxococcota bacterium]
PRIMSKYPRTEKEMEPIERHKVEKRNGPYLAKTGNSALYFLPFLLAQEAAHQTMEEAQLHPEECCLIQVETRRTSEAQAARDRAARNPHPRHKHIVVTLESCQITLITESRMDPKAHNDTEQTSCPQTAPFVSSVLELLTLPIEHTANIH